MAEQKYRFLPTAKNNLSPEEVVPQEKPQVKGEQLCPCCGYITIPKGGECTAYICPVCLWEMDAFIRSDEEASDQNHGLTLKEARENYRIYGAVIERLKQYCREPYPEEIPQNQGK